MATWNKLTTPENYKSALQRLDELIDVEHTEATHNELMLLSLLIEAYEEVHYPIRDASPLRVLRFMMEMKGLRQQDLIPILGSKGNVSKILSGKAKLQLEDIYPLSTLLGISAEALIPRSDSEYAAIGVIAEYADQVTTPEQLLNAWAVAAEEAIDWDESISEGAEKGLKKTKVKH